MDISLKREDYKILKENKEHSKEEIVEAELNLPEYMPEILRIVKSTADIRITSCRAVGERISVDGVCELGIIYTADDGCIYTFSQPKQFTAFCEDSSFEKAVDFNATASVGYVNCRATATRRAEIKAGVMVKFNVYFEETETVLSVTGESKLQTQQRSIDCLSLGCKKTKSFSMSDTVNLSAPSAFIVSKRATAVLTEVRRISNKIMLKGDVVVFICYVNSENKAQVEHISHSIPLNQILELEGLEESFTGDVDLKVTAIEVILKGEQGNFTTAFDLSLGIDASVTMWEEKALSVISDAYCIDGVSELKKESQVYLSVLDKISDTYICDNSFSVPGDGVEKVLDATGEITGLKVNVGSDSLNITGSLCASFIIRDVNNSVSLVNKAFDFSYKRSADYVADCPVCEPVINITSLKYSVKDSNTVELRAELKITSTVFDKKAVATVTDISVSDAPNGEKRLPVVIYFPQSENEALWSIAKKYNTTVTAIAEENNLQGETTENSKILFIPSA